MATHNITIPIYRISRAIYYVWCCFSNGC